MKSLNKNRYELNVLIIFYVFIYILKFLAGSQFDAILMLKTFKDYVYHNKGI